MQRKSTKGKETLSYCSNYTRNCYIYKDKQKKNRKTLKIAGLIGKTIMKFFVCMQFCSLYPRLHTTILGLCRFELRTHCTSNSNLCNFKRFSLILVSYTTITDFCEFPWSNNVFTVIFFNFPFMAYNKNSKLICFLLMPLYFAYLFASQ